MLPNLSLLEVSTAGGVACGYGQISTGFDDLPDDVRNNIIKLTQSDKKVVSGSLYGVQFKDDPSTSLHYDPLPTRDKFINAFQSQPLNKSIDEALFAAADLLKEAGMLTFDFPIADGILSKMAADIIAKGKFPEGMTARKVETFKVYRFSFSVPRPMSKDHPIATNHWTQTDKFLTLLAFLTEKLKELSKLKESSKLNKLSSKPMNKIVDEFFLKNVTLPALEGLEKIMLAN
jgi:hypothetical protein